MHDSTMKIVNSGGPEISTVQDRNLELFGEGKRVSTGVIGMQTSQGYVSTSNSVIDADPDFFDLSPSPMWLEDYSGVKALFTEWRDAGVTDLADYLAEDPERVRRCSALIRVLKVNERVLQLYKVADLAELEEKLSVIFSADMMKTHAQELVALWRGDHAFFSHTVNYTATGDRLDIQLSGKIMPGHEHDWSRVLVVTEDMTEREGARAAQAASERFARGLFEHSPVSLWVEDFSEIKKLLDELRLRGIQDFRVFTDVHPEFINRCMSEIRVIDINHTTIKLFGAPDKRVLLHSLGRIFRDKMVQPFREQLIDLWNGQLFQTREVVNYALDGRELHLMLQFSVLPGAENDWSLVQVALTDITARKAAEAYLEFLGKHDALTKLFNRSFYIDELNRLQRSGTEPISIIIIDLNNLKEVNDSLGHAAGDDLLRRAGEVLGKLVEAPGHAARIGGDEFALTLPGLDEVHAGKILKDLDGLCDLNNQFYSTASSRLSLSAGLATSRDGESLEATARRADNAMYMAKREYHRKLSASR